MYVIITLPRHDYCGVLESVQREKAILKPGVMITRTTLEQMANHEFGLFGAVVEVTTQNLEARIPIELRDISTYQIVPLGREEDIGRTLQKYASARELSF